jgi:hypothetical protein
MLSEEEDIASKMAAMQSVIQSLSSQVEQLNVRMVSCKLITSFLELKICYF